MRSELEALSAGIDDFPSDLSSVFTQEESSKLENAAMDLSSVPEALVTIRAARDKMKGKSEGKSEPAVSFSGKGKRKWRKPNPAKHLQDKFSASVDNVVIGLVILNALEIETQISRLGQMINRFQIARTVEPSWWLNGLDNLASFLHVQICVSILSMRTSQFLLLSLAPFIQHAQLMLKNFCRSVMENSEPSASKSDLGANYKSLLEDFGLKHEIDETREAERYKIW